MIWNAYIIIIIMVLLYTFNSWSIMLKHVVKLYKGKQDTNMDKWNKIQQMAHAVKYHII